MLCRTGALPFSPDPGVIAWVSGPPPERDLVVASFQKRLRCANCLQIATPHRPARLGAHANRSQLHVFREAHVELPLSWNHADLLFLLVSAERVDGRMRYYINRVSACLMPLNARSVVDDNSVQIISQSAARRHRICVLRPRSVQPCPAASIRNASPCRTQRRVVITADDLRHRVNYEAVDMGKSASPSRSLDLPAALGLSPAVCVATVPSSRTTSTSRGSWAHKGALRSGALAWASTWPTRTSAEPSPATPMLGRWSIATIYAVVGEQARVYKAQRWVAWCWTTDGRRLEPRAGFDGEWLSRPRDLADGNRKFGRVRWVISIAGGSVPCRGNSYENTEKQERPAVQPHPCSPRPRGRRRRALSLLRPFKSKCPFFRGT